MKKNQLGNSDMMVSALCLGTMTFGEQNTEQEAWTQLDYATEKGINFIDTAELYPIPPKPSTQGSTETYIGNWVKAKNNRDKIILASKVVGRSVMNWFRDDASNAKINKAQIHEAINKSLKRLQTDYLDLYQIHWPDRTLRLFEKKLNHYDENPDDGFSILQTIEIMDELIKAGKIRGFGLSNETSWGTMEFITQAKHNNLSQIVSIQNAYNLITRNFESDLAEISKNEQTGLLAYSPLAQGYLSAKYENNSLPKGSRKELFDRLTRYEKPGAQTAMNKYFKLARENNLSPAKMALQFVNSQPFVTSNIIGATNLEQLKENIAAIDEDIEPEVLEEINKIHQIHCNPAP